MVIASTMLNYCGIDTMLHITCYGAKKATMLQHLSRAKDFGIRNLLALRGGRQLPVSRHRSSSSFRLLRSDPAVGEEWDPDKSDFRYGSDLVRFIREHFDDYFVICVAGRPHRLLRDEVM